MNKIYLMLMIGGFLLMLNMSNASAGIVEDALHLLGIYQKDEFVSLVSNTDQCIFDECQTVYQICNPTGSDISADSFNVTYINEDKLSKKNNYIIQNTIEDNKTKEVKTKLEKDKFSFKKNTCYNISIEGNLMPNSAVDNVISFNGYTYPEYAWWNSSWAYCKDINVRNPESEAFLKFPVPVKITNINGFKSDGTDVRFVNASCNNSGSTLFHNIEQFNQSGDGTGYFWVRVNSIGSSASQNISIYYGNPTAIDTSHYNTWDGQDGVWLMQETTGATFLIDRATSTPANLVFSGHNVSLSTAGIYGNAQYFDGSSDYVYVGDTADLRVAINTDFSIQLWLKVENGSDPNGKLVGKGGTDYYDSEVISTGYVKFTAQNDTTGGYTQSALQVNDTNWHYVVMKRIGNTLYTFIDGIQTSANARTGIPAVGSTNNFQISATGTNSFLGLIDYVTFDNNGYPTNKMINATYQITKYPDNFITITNYPANTCTYSSGNWAINCADNCAYTSTTNIAGNVTTSGTGTITFNSGGKWHFTGTGQTININPGCEIRVNSGGSLSE